MPYLRTKRNAHDTCLEIRTAVTPPMADDNTVMQRNDIMFQARRANTAPCGEDVLRSCRSSPRHLRLWAKKKKKKKEVSLLRCSLVRVVWKM